MNLGQRVIDALRWLTLSRALGQLVAWASTLIVIRLLAPDVYGLMAMAMLIIGLLGLCSELGLEAALIQSPTLDRALIEQVFGLTLLVNCGLYLGVFFSAPLVAGFFAEPRLTLIVQVVGLQFLVQAVAAVPLALLQREMRFRRRALLDFCKMLTASLVTLALALAGSGVWSLVWGTLSGLLLEAVGAWISAGRGYRPCFRLRGLGRLAAFGGWVTVSRLLWYVYAHADGFIVGKLLGKEALGLYTVGKQLASLPISKLQNIINEIGFAAFSRLQHEQKQYRIQFLKAVRLLSFCAFPVFFGIAAVAPELVRVILGTTWEDAILPLQMLSLVGPLRMLQSLVMPALMGLGRPDVQVYNLLLACVLLPTAFIIGAQWGVNGVAIAWLIAFPLFLLWVLMRALPILGITLGEFWAAVRPSLLGSTLMLVVVYSLRPALAGNDELWILAVLIGLGAGIYALTVLLLQRALWREFSVLFLKSGI